MFIIINIWLSFDSIVLAVYTISMRGHFWSCLARWIMLFISNFSVNRCVFCMLITHILIDNNVLICWLTEVTLVLTIHNSVWLRPLITVFVFITQHFWSLSIKQIKRELHNFILRKKKLNNNHRVFWPCFFVWKAQITLSMIQYRLTLPLSRQVEAMIANQC